MVSIIPLFLMGLSVLVIILLGVVGPYVDSEVSFAVGLVLAVVPMIVALVWWVMEMIKSKPCEECHLKLGHTKVCSQYTPDYSGGA